MQDYTEFFIRSSDTIIQGEIKIGKPTIICSFFHRVSSSFFPLSYNKSSCEHFRSCHLLVQLQILEIRIRHCPRELYR